MMRMYMAFMQVRNISLHFIKLTKQCRLIFVHVVGDHPKGEIVEIIAVSNASEWLEVKSTVINDVCIQLLYLTFFAYYF